MSGYGGVDDHNANIEAVIQNSLDIVRAKLPTGESATHCRDNNCGEAIPEGRRQALKGVKYCIECAPNHVQHIRIRAVDYIL